MSQVVCDISISADGYSAGHNQTEKRPFGDGDTSMLHAWMFDTPEDNRAEREAITSAKAFIMGRNMFGPIRGEWSGDWKGWRGPEPPYHAPVFVLTHYRRDPLVMDSGMTFHFVIDARRWREPRSRAATRRRARRHIEQETSRPLPARRRSHRPWAGSSRRAPRGPRAHLL